MTIFSNWAETRCWRRRWYRGYGRYLGGRCRWRWYFSRGGWRGGGGGVGKEIEGGERGGSLPLSFAQQRLWFINQLEPGSAAYNVVSALRIQGRLDGAALGKALQEVVRRHEVLRTRFEWQGIEPRQVDR